jgi:superfamily I DNA/RNA helicase
MTPYLVQRIQDGTWAELITGGDRWRAAALKWGADLATKPQIRIGTVHAAKGMEADTVCLATTTSRRVHESQGLDPAQFDEERRVEYVAVTRARKKLILCTEPADYRMMI